MRMRLSNRCHLMDSSAVVKLVIVCPPIELVSSTLSVLLSEPMAPGYIMNLVREVWRSHQSWRQQTAEPCKGSGQMQHVKVLSQGMDLRTLTQMAE